MKTKEKAIELVNKYSTKLPYYSEKDNLNKSKECALILVNEVLKEYWSHNTKRRDWWQEIKIEIEKL